VSCAMLAVTSGAWMPFRWQISMVVGVERTVAEPLEPFRTMLSMVSEKATVDRWARR